MARRKRYKSQALTVDVPARMNLQTAEWFARNSQRIVRGEAASLLNAVRMNAPAKTGALRGGLVLRPGVENSKLGVTVADIWPDPAKNSIFASVSKAGKRGYYPSSQEYGFRTRLGTGKSTTKSGKVRTWGTKARVKGRYYMKVPAAGEHTSWQNRVSQEVDTYLKEEANKD